MLTDKDNGQEGLDNSSQDNDNSEGKKRRRVRVGDVRQPGGYPQSTERKPYRSSEGESRGSSYGNSDRGERQSYGYQDRSDNRGGYSQPNYGQDRGERRPYQGGGERRPYQSGGDRRPYQDRGGDSRPYQDRGGDSRPYQDRGGDRPYQGGGERRPYQSGGDRRPYQDRGGDRRPYQDRGGDRRSNSGYNSRGGSGGFHREEEAGPKRLVKPVKYKENVDPTSELRLNKYLANAGVCSRREADAHIVAGVVKVNGEVVNELGAKVTRADVVTFHDQVVQIESKVYVLLNKPKNCVTTSDDPQNRLTVMDLVKNSCAERIYPVGRLDRNTTGVLLLTNDGDLASKLMHPKYKKKKIYQVTLDRDVTMEDMQSIADGVELDDGEIHADSIAYNSEEELNVVGIEIHSGRNRIVRRIFEKLNYKVIKLDRVYFSGLTKKNVPRGKWRYLSETEVNMLRMGAFE